MTFKKKLFLGVLVFIVLVTFAVWFINSSSTNYSKTSKTYVRGASVEIDTAVAQAQLIYEQKKKQGVDFSNGPCLTNDLMPSWVADIAHNPRIALDNLPQNQCQAYIEGRAKHFVELDSQGNLIRVR